MKNFSENIKYIGVDDRDLDLFEGQYVVPEGMAYNSSHTARRSCITNLYLRNIFTTAQLMAISGHKSEKAFNEYICCSSDEIADRIAEIAENAKKHRSDMF